MSDIFLRAGSFITIIVLGFFLKQIGVFRQEDFSVLSRITLRITLPAAIITSFQGSRMDRSLLLLVLLGTGAGLLYVAIGFMMNLKASREKQAFDLLNYSGYNIGTFMLPFAQSFLGPVGVMTTSLFDTGNAVVCLGGAFSLATMVKEGGRFSFRRIVRSLVRSVPFLCYVLMLGLNLAQIQLPEFVRRCAAVIADANPFMAMLMLGVGFQLSWQASQLKTIGKMLAIRYGVAGILAAGFYWLLPFSLEIRQTLVLLAFSPISSAVPAFTQELKGDTGLSSALNSLSIVISICITVVLLSVML